MRNDLLNKNTTLVTLAPNVFRNPISLILVCAVNMAIPSIPRQARLTAKKAI